MNNDYTIIGGDLLYILCIIVIYKPNIKELKANVNCLANNVQTVIVWQNSELTEKEKKEICCGLDRSNVFFAGNGNNEGIPKAINYAIGYMLNNHYDYLLTMDQDSQWINLQEYLTFVLREPTNCIYGPMILANTDTDKTNLNKDGMETETTNYVITSGMLCHRDVIHQIGLYNEKLFIDGVDEEYCFRGRRKGILSKVVNGAYLQQHFGNSRIVNFMGRKTIVSDYSAFRYYYIVRNHTFLIRSGLLTIKEKKQTYNNYIKAPIIKVILFERQKGRKLWSIIRGLRSGMRMKKGEESQ